MKTPKNISIKSFEKSAISHTQTNLVKGGDPEGHSGNVAIIVDWC
ncbi:MAG: hypothetical protein ACPG49_05165 [Chitinophagales bacterium]